nr:comb plate cilium protein CTENO189 [Bolinopsis mikado]
MSSLSRRKTGGGLRSTLSLGRTGSLSNRPKDFYCTVFGQMDRSQTNLAVVLRTYFYPREEMTGALKNVEERWDDNASFKIICNHEVNSDPPSVMLCNPVSIKAKPGSQFRIDLLNQEAYLDTSEFFTEGPQLPKCLQFDISLESYNITASPDTASTDHVPAIKIIRSPDETHVASIPLVHLCDIPDAAMTGSFAFDDFCYAVDPKPRFGVKCEHNRTWHRLPQLLIKFLTEDRGLASKVMDIAKEWENHAGLQLIHVPQDSSRDAQIRIKFSSRNQSAIGTDAEDIPDDKPTMYLNVSRDTHPVLFRRRVLHQFGHALGLYHEFEELPEEVEFDEAGVQLDTSMEAGWTTDQTRTHVFNKKSCSNNDHFDRLSIMTQTFKRPYVKGWLPRQHQSVLSVDDKTLIKALYPPPHATHQWADPLATPEPLDEDEEDEEESDDEEEMTEWKRAAMEREREDMTPVDMFSGVFADKNEITGRTFSDSEQPSTPPASVDVDGRGRRKRTEHSVGIEFEPTDSGKKKLSLSASMFEFDTDKQTVSRKESIKPGTGGRFIDHETVKYTKEEVDTDIREGDFFSFRDQAILREQEMPVDDRLPTPLFSPPDTPDSIPDSLAPTPVSKLFLSDAFLDIREDWLHVNQENMISLTHESVPGTRKQKMQLHPGDVRFADAGDFESRDFRGDKVQKDTYGQGHLENELFGERTHVVSPTGLVEREQFYRTLVGLQEGGKKKEEEIITFAEKMERINKEKSKQDEFFEPVRQYVGESEIQGLGFDAPEPRKLRKSVEFEPGDKPKKGKGKGKAKKQKLKTVDEHEDETFYNRSFRKAQQKEIDDKEDNFSFREKLQNREYIKAPIKVGLQEMQPADEDIFDLLDRASKDTRNFGRGKFVSSNKAPALISTKGTFAGIGGSGSFRELGWASYYEYEEDEMLDYEYQEATQDKDMDLLTFRERLQKRSGVAIHNGIEVTPAASEARNYLESPTPVANRSFETEERIKNKMLKNKAGRYYDDGIDMVSPVDLVEEALDRGFRSKSKDKSGDERESEDEISREKKEAARRHYGIRKSPSDDDIARTKQQIKADAKSEKSGKSRSPSGDKTHRSSRASQGSHAKDMKQEKAPSATSQDDRKKAGFEDRSDSQRGSDSRPVRSGRSQHSQRDRGSVEDQLDKSAAHSRTDTKSKTSGIRPSPEMSEVSVEADLNWNLDRSHVKTAKSKASASAMFERSQDQEDEESPFLPPITPKNKPKPKSKAFVVSKEIATQITADALIPPQPMGDFWVNKDTVLNRNDPYADVALRMPTGMSHERSFFEQEDRPATYRSTFTAYEPPSEAYEKPKFEMLSDPEDDERPDVYTRLSDAKAYKQSGQAVDVWAQKTDISFTVLLYLKKNLGINWKRAGQYLGVSRERLRRIEDIGIASARTGIEKMSQDMLFEWAEKDPQPTVAKLCAALEAADLSRLAQGVMDKVNKEKIPPKRKRKGGRSRKVDAPVKVPISEETIPYRVMVYLKDNLGESWKDLAVCLKIPSPRIKGIEADAWQVEKMAYDMLHEWRQREKENATVDRLIEALERAQCKKLVKGVQARCQSYHFRINA